MAIILVGLAVTLLQGRGRATDIYNHNTFDGEAKIVAATFTSAFCSVCKIIEPRLANVIPEFNGSPVQFLELDFTFGKTDHHEKLAQKNGFTDVYHRFKAGTGYTLLINPATGDVIDMLTINHSEKAMRAAIAQALARADIDELERELLN